MEQVDLSPQTFQEHLHFPPQIDQLFEANSILETGAPAPEASLQSPSPSHECLLPFNLSI